MLSRRKRRADVRRKLRQLAREVGPRRPDTVMEWPTLPRREFLWQRLGRYDHEVAFTEGSSSYTGRVRCASY